MRRKWLITKAQSDRMEWLAYMTYVGAKEGTFAFLVPDNTSSHAAMHKYSPP